ncbi:MAG: alcohol dehydrogenase [Nitrosopumilaceae archaeon]|jgi:propanol-preferring alcohol dehydrogenase
MTSFQPKIHQKKTLPLFYKAAQLVEIKKPLIINNIKTPTLDKSQVLVRVKATGVCHSDLHLVEGSYDLGRGEILKVAERGVKLPLVPGHEIAGIIAKTGGEVNGFQIGDKVIVYPWIGCGKCQTCRSGNENLCDWPKSIGIFQDGGYAEFVVIPDSKYLIRIQTEDLEGYASLTCAGLTAYNAIKKANSKPEPQTIMIVGAGGLALMAIQIAKEITSAKIICVARNQKKLEKAKESGADHIIDSTSKGYVQDILSLCNDKGPESIVDFVNVPETVKVDIEVLPKRGNLVLVGLFGGSIKIPLVNFPLKAITIQGAYTGSYQDLVELTDLAEKNLIKPIATKKYSLNEINQALEDLKQKQIIGRAVIVPT